MKKKQNQPTPARPNLFGLLRPHAGLVMLLISMTLVANGLNLAIPRIISNALDAFAVGTFVMRSTLITFSVVAGIIFLATYVQSVIQTYAAERVARDLRTKLADKISRQEFASVSALTPAKLLTNLTADIDAVKLFVSQAVASIVSSVFLIIGASVLLIVTNWRLGLMVLAVVPVIGFAFFFVFSKIRVLFGRAQGAIDWLNKVINESILGAGLIRLVNAQQVEYQKFMKANTEARDVSLGILKLFASIIPIITFLTNVATLLILVVGGRYVIGGTMTLGEFAAFNGYLAILIFPVIMLGFMSSLIGQASAAYARIAPVLQEKEREDSGTYITRIRGDIVLSDVSLVYGEKYVLKNVSISIPAGTRTAIVGPTAAGKTQLLSIMTGLVIPTTGVVSYDGVPLAEYAKKAFHEQVAMVFQDSALFNTTVRENIAFGTTVQESAFEKAIATAELGDFIAALPDGLATVVSERGASLSGGQKQRVMLARALALDPSVLFLDDFTARVDARTEKKILENVRTHFSDITLVSVTQKISSIQDYDQIIVLMEGEVLATGTHSELLVSSPEYVQMYDSQESTNHYELHA